jgi:protein-tyrosine phosphatase
MGSRRFVDIHCHVLPGLDDGARDEAEALAMAAAACRDGTGSVIATPHQLGGNAGVTPAAIRAGVADLNRALAAAGIPLTVLPGADVRIEPELPFLLKRGAVLTLADRGRHVLLELPHGVYLPLEPLLAALRKQGLTGILSHPERNQGIVARPAVIADVVRAGGLIQITAASLLGGFGGAARRVAEFCVRERLVHFVASDAHDTSRRPIGLAAAHAAIAALADPGLADAVAIENPGRVADGLEVAAPRGAERRRGRGLLGWLGDRAA